MDKDLINKLILVGFVAGAILGLYFIMSPYQDCKRNYVEADDGRYKEGRTIHCLDITTW